MGGMGPASGGLSLRELVMACPCGRAPAFCGRRTCYLQSETSSRGPNIPIRSESALRACETTSTWFSADVWK
jgi:hypothetical protein